VRQHNQSLRIMHWPTRILRNADPNAIALLFALRSRSRSFHPAHDPTSKARIGKSSIVSPSTSVVTWHQNVSAMPKLLKNDEWSLENCNIPAHEDYRENPR